MNPRLLHPIHPERVCWGCDRLCPADDLRCANGSIRTPHPCELFGDDWLESSMSDVSTGAARDEPRSRDVREAGQPRRETDARGAES